MGVISKAIPGGFSGKLGKVTGSNWNGIACMCSPSASQLEQQAKFKTVMGFLNAMALLLETGFREYAIRMTAFNKAFSYNLKNAVTRSYPDFSIGYVMARATCPMPAAPFKGRGVQTWLGFIAESGKAIANSVYTGRIVLP